MARKIGEEFCLDLKRERVFAYSNECSVLVVAAMCEGINLGHKFPSISVETTRSGLLVVADGHHRVLAHLSMGLPCKSRYCGEAGDFYFWPIEAVYLGNNNDMNDRHRLRSALGYLPRDVTERFCRENDLDLSDYLSQ